MGFGCVLVILKNKRIVLFGILKDVLGKDKWNLELFQIQWVLDLLVILIDGEGLGLKISRADFIEIDFQLIFWINTFRAVFLHLLQIGSRTDFLGNSENFGFGKRLFPALEVEYLVVVNEGVWGKGIDGVVFGGLERRPERLSKGVDFEGLGVSISHRYRRFSKRNKVKLKLEIRRISLGNIFLQCPL